MARIEWNPGLAVGVRSIDDQHRRLIELANRLIAAARLTDPAQLAQAFRELRQYTVNHFSDEEEHMQRAKYPKLHEHRQQHNDLKARVKHFQDACYRKSDLTEAEVVEFMKAWLIDHIIYSDLEFKKHLENAGQAS